MSKVDLTKKQISVLHSVVNKVKTETCAEVTLGGYAGTGKTTLIKYLCGFFPQFAVCAYTGKAANVLRRKGISHASTIHSCIYKPIIENGQVYFELDPMLAYEGFIVDEASMVGHDIYDDLKSFGIPMIFVGDHGQLEPIGSDFNLMHSPDYRLEEIHRNAGDIAKFAEHVRKGYSSRMYQTDTDKVQFVTSVNDDLLCKVDQIICAYNKTRCSMNERVRKHRGLKGLLNVGERVMCLRNNKNLGLFNGMQGTVLDLRKNKKGRPVMDFEFDGDVYHDIVYDTEQFGRDAYKINHFGKEAPNPFDYAYCITAHKAQGDEWNNVLVIEQKCASWDHKRWAYTAASRARDTMYWKLA